MTLESETSNKITVKTTEHYHKSIYDGSELVPVENEYIDTNSDFILEKIDGEWKIKSFRMPN